MVFLAMKVLTIWSVAALVAGFGLGALIRTAERAQKEDVLSTLFATLADGRIARWGEGRRAPNRLLNGSKQAIPWNPFNPTNRTIPQSLRTPGHRSALPWVSPP